MWLIIRSPGRTVENKQENDSEEKTPELDTPPSDSKDQDRASRQNVLKCDMCSTKTVFTRRSEYKKHLDRHNRPYKCTREGCSAAPFGDAGGLYRHQREVHKTQEGDRPITEFLCPEKGCDRHVRGFPRRWNLIEHQRRVHGLDKEEAGDESRVIKRFKRVKSELSSPTDTVKSDETSERQSTTVNQSLTGLSQPRSPVDTVRREVLIGLRAELRKMEYQRSRMDRDIEAMRITIERYE
ncbi:MAG: hypothetical protein M4579_005575 [Chaenotheca gracillima]|nr:MAG: hypothetical protein M4579_005575 [Chaenotheca gracillima]